MTVIHKKHSLLKNINSQKILFHENHSVNFLALLSFVESHRLDLDYRARRKSTYLFHQNGNTNSAKTESILALGRLNDTISIFKSSMKVVDLKDLIRTCLKVVQISKISIPLQMTTKQECRFSLLCIYQVITKPTYIFVDPFLVLTKYIFDNINKY